MTEANGRKPVPAAQPAVGLITSAAIFLVVTVDEGDEAEAAARGICGDLAGLVRAVGFRDIGAGLSCVLGIGSDLWDRLSGSERPIDLHPFREISAAGRRAVATPGDLLFHIRSDRFDMCFELAAQITASLGDAVTPVDEVHGFRYFENRDLLGFVDGTENPVGAALEEAAIIGDEDPAFSGGSYVIIQKYLHDIERWNAVPTEDQERIIGRTKLADIELADDVKPTNSHSALTTIESDGREIKIVRDNMPFGKAGSGEFGTYFIGYARSPAPIELMLQNMFVGRPVGNYDRILDFSTAVTGNLFFVPSLPMLEALADGPRPDSDASEEPPEGAAPAPGTLGIGSLKSPSEPD